MNILEKLVQQNRLPVLFVGSGISRRYLKDYPSWPELLELSYKKFSDDEFAYYGLINKFKRAGLSDFDIYAELASHIELEFNDAYFNRKFKIGTSKNPSWLKRGTSPYKMFLALFFKKMQLNVSPVLNKELTEFKKLHNKISAVITTNYDLFLEEIVFTDDFTVFTRQNQLFSAESYNCAEIYKIHGSAKDADSIIITKKDYENFDASRKLIIAKMLTLFADSPIIFMGYSFTDEDVQGVISDFLDCLTPKELQNIDQHFVFISYKEGESNLVECKRSITTKNGKIIPFTEIITDNFYEVYHILNQLVPGISPKRVRETKRVIKNIVDSTVTNKESESVVIGIDDLDSIDLSDKPLAIAIGYRETILGNYGYSQLGDAVIIEDLLFDNKNLNADAMCKQRFASIPINRIIPVFKYYRKCSVNIPTNSKLQAYIDAHNSVDKIISGSVTKSYEKQPRFTDIQELSSAIENETSIYKKYGLLMVNMQNFDIATTKEICKLLFTENRDEAVRSSIFKRCVMYIDLIENYIEKD